VAHATVGALAIAQMVERVLDATSLYARRAWPVYCGEILNLLGIFFMLMFLLFIDC
jgi:hypothetical protein